MKFLKKFLDKFGSSINSERPDNTDALYSLTSASGSFEDKLGFKFSGSSALCIKIIDGLIFENTIKDCTDLLNVSKKEFNFDYNVSTDSYGYLWIIITGRTNPVYSEIISNVTAALTSIGKILEENGFSNQILSAVFKYEFSNRIFSSFGSDRKYGYRETNSYNPITNTIYLIYNYKTQNFYPYLPLDAYKRDTTKELQTISIIKNFISVEPDVSKWFPIKDIPF